jgi:CubicO group peptidase (beta-lactamase class C family)
VNRLRFQPQQIALCLALVGYASLCPGHISGSGKTEANQVWPVQTWHTSPPHEQDISSALLAQMFEHIVDRELLIDSVHVVRNGYVVLDAYQYPFTKDYLHIIHSCTKSIMSTLIGLAIDDGLISGVDEELVDVFPELAEGSRLDVEHLLTMTTGLDSRDSYLYRWEGLSEMRRSEDWVEFALSRSEAASPGSRFDYSNMASFLLSALLQRKTGRTAEEYAQQRLFGPIGIEEVQWPKNPQGINIGWGELRMHPLDLARIGLLYLRDGEWNGEQIVPKSWVHRATKRQVTAGTLREHYGYQWWVDSSGVYMALGYAGQYLIVNPDLDLVVVFTSSLPDQQFYAPWELYAEYIIPAVGQRRESDLETAIENFAKGPDSRAGVLPPAHSSIDGVPYLLEANPFGMTGLTISFADGEALVREHYGETAVDHRTGLDGRYVLNDLGDQGTVAVRGEWTAEDRFEVEYYSIGGAWHTELSLRYHDGVLDATAPRASGADIRFSGTATP